MKKIKEPNFLEWNKNIFVSSIKKINLNIILIIILDALFYILSGYLVIFWLQRIQAKMAAFDLPADIAALGLEKAQQLVSEARAFLFLLIFSFILLLISIIFLAGIFKGIIWAKTTNTKISFNLISKFLILNLIWMGFWFALIILVSLLIEPALAPKFMLVTIILGLYFTNTLYTIFMKKQTLKSMIDAIRLNVTKIHLFLLPYTIISALFFIIVKISIFFKFEYSTILFNLIMLINIAIIRYYVSRLVLEIEECK